MQPFPELSIDIVAGLFLSRAQASNTTAGAFLWGLFEAVDGSVTRFLMTTAGYLSFCVPCSNSPVEAPTALFKAFQIATPLAQGRCLQDGFR